MGYQGDKKMGFLCANPLDFGSSVPWAEGGQQGIAYLHTVTMSCVQHLQGGGTRSSDMNTGVVPPLGTPFWKADLLVWEPQLGVVGLSFHPL